MALLIGAASHRYIISSRIVCKIVVNMLLILGSMLVTTRVGYLVGLVRVQNDLLYLSFIHLKLRTLIVLVPRLG